MFFHRQCFRFLVVIVLSLMPAQFLRADIMVNNFDDILHWTGSGSNRAALVIDWNDSSAPLVWGYRFNGTATGEDMLKAIVIADSRLYAKVQYFTFSGQSSMFVHGLGYDRDADGFSIESGDNFGATGFLESSITEDARALGPQDSYRETKRWSATWGYFEASGFTFPTNWTGSQIGVSGRQLTDLSWDGWRFDDSSSLGPRAGFAAVPEPSSLALLGIAGCGAVWWRRRKSKKGVRADV